MSNPEKTGGKQVTGKEATQFKPGQSGNPKGRPKGSRNKLTEKFFKDALNVWKEGGEDALKKMMADKPGDFAKMISGVVSKEDKVKHEHDHGGEVHVKTTVNVVHVKPDADNE